MNLIIFLLASIGMTFILVDGSILKSFKRWLSKGGWIRSKLLELLSCHQCSGFHSGWIIGLFMWLINSDPLCLSHNWFMLFGLLIYGYVSSYVSVMAAIISVWIQSNTKVAE